ncbi:MAG: UbiX family flavin prenyltransferase [Alphaproteobacteria bacterium]
MKEVKKLIVGMSGASGIVYGIRMVELLHAAGVETHLVVSKAAELTLAYETDRRMGEIAALAHRTYPVRDVGAAIASGSFRMDGMVIAPCSIKTMSEIATGVTTTLLTRAADVTLKERRRLVLMVRETPFHTGHLRTMTALSEMGAIIAPPIPAFYGRPKTLEDLIDHSVGRVLDLVGVDTTDYQRWGEDIAPGPHPDRARKVGGDRQAPAAPDDGEEPGSETEA